ncbi:MAG TPA: Crp/Fnr family transcriptional regulator [Pyrinomonadaceae bacterium]
MQLLQPDTAHTKSMFERNELGKHENSARASSNSALSELRGLDHVKVSKNYARGTALFVEGQQPRGLFILSKGRVKVSIASPEGKTLILRIARPGDLLGINASLSGRPYSTTAETLERCTVDFISRTDLLRLLERDKQFYVEVAQALSLKLSNVVEHTRLLFLAQSSAEKLARLLVKWCDEHGTRTGNGICINYSLTHEEMGQMICASRETVTRLLAELKRKKIVNLVDNTIIVRNREALESVARCEPRYLC